MQLRLTNGKETYLVGKKVVGKRLWEILCSIEEEKSKILSEEQKEWLEGQVSGFKSSTGEDWWIEIYRSN